MKIPDLKHFDVKQFEKDLQTLKDYAVPLKEEIENQKAIIAISQEKLKDRMEMVKILENLE